MSAIISFLEGSGLDGAGRKIREIHAFGLGALERHHDFIQWIFPLAEPSGAVPGSPVLLPADVGAIRASEPAQLNLTKSRRLMTGFYADTDHWLREQDHNHLRISRIIKSLRLLVGGPVADGFRGEILMRVTTRGAPVGQVTLDHWGRA